MLRRMMHFVTLCVAIYLLVNMHHLVQQKFTRIPLAKNIFTETLLAETLRISSLQQTGNQDIQPEQQVKCTTGDLPIPQHMFNNTQASISCSQLINGTNKTTYAEAKALMEQHPMRQVHDEHISTLVKDCKTFQKSRGYHMHHGTEEELHFPIAFNILTHKDAYQVEYLLRAIYRPQNQYCIHIDAKQPAPFKQAITDLAGCFDNVFIASKLEHVVYGGFSRLQADINCMKDQLNTTRKWKYLFNLAAQSFPVKTNREMVEILKIYNGSNDIEGISGKRIIRERFEDEYKEITDKNGNRVLVKTDGKNPPAPYNIDIVRGSAYGIFSRKFVDFIIHDNKSQALLEWSRNTATPDEHYWATLHHTYTNPHLHTPGGYSGRPDEKPWLAVWVAWGGENPCHGQWMRGYCVFGIEDLPAIVSRHEFFINKLYYTYQPLTLECLNTWLEHKVTCPVDIDRDFYNKLPFIIR